MNADPTGSGSKSLISNILSSLFKNIFEINFTKYAINRYYTLDPSMDPVYSEAWFRFFFSVTLIWINGKINWIHSPVLIKSEVRNIHLNLFRDAYNHSMTEDSEIVLRLAGLADKIFWTG